MTEKRFKITADRIHLAFCFCCLLTFPFMIGVPSFMASESGNRSCIEADCKTYCSSEKTVNELSTQGMPTELQGCK